MMATAGAPAAPDLDAWLPEPALRVAHRRTSEVRADELWRAARAVRLCDAGLLGRLVRWRIPGLNAELAFDELFRAPPFAVLDEGEHALVSGLVGRIWTLRRDYPCLRDAHEFRGWSQPGTARVVIANWVTDGALHSETRVQAFGAQGRVGLAAVRPLVAAFGALVGSEGLAAAIHEAARSSGRV